MGFAFPNESDLPHLKPGDLVAGRFRIVEIIGSGGFSVVYRAHQEGMNRFVALKVLKPRASADAKIVERFRREALFASQLSHPNTITLFDYGQTDEGLCYIAMEHLSGRDLGEELRYRDPLDLKRVWLIAAQICRSLSEAHRLGLIHRDLKPENVFLIERNGRDHVKVLDFGVSKALSDFGRAHATSLAPLTQEGTVFGTPLYMAPEQAMAEEITPAVDVYALGHIIFEMITGRAAYDDDISAMDVMLMQINDPPLALPVPWDQTPFAELVRRCTEKEPHLRIRNATQLLDVLMGEAFLPYMDFAEIPPALRAVRKEEARPQLPPVHEESHQGLVEQIYRWELAVLAETLDEVRESAQTRLVVISGKPGTGRSNLLRAFLKRHQDQAGLRVLHRKASQNGNANQSGLEVDLAQVTGLPLRGEGIGEVNRLLREVLSDSNQPTMEEMRAVRIDSNPLQELSLNRENFFARLIKPFRRAARVGTLVWGIENLESVDPLTLAFLDRFIREMRVHPSPILLVITVSPESLTARPGLMRYTEAILQAPSTYARHLEILEPGVVKDRDQASLQRLRQLADVPSDVDVDGSYSGKRQPPKPEEPDEDEIAYWAALADGVTVEEPPAPKAATPPSVKPARSERISGATERLELFTTAETARLQAEKTDVSEAFDLVMGYLAQLGERVVHRELWRFIYHRVLPFETTRMMGAIIDHARRFGIVTASDESIAFADPVYVESLRETFEELPDAVARHRELARLLEEYAPKPDRHSLRRIVEHSVLGEDYERAIRQLLRAAEMAYGENDLDSAREYYLQFQTLLEELATRAPTPEVVFHSFAEVWLRIGKIQGAFGEFGAAEDALKRCINEAEEQEPRVRATAFKLLGDLAVSQDRFADGRHYFEQARDLYHQTALARPYVASIGEIGRCAVRLGFPRQAEGILLQAIDKAEKLQDEGLAARLHRYMGEVLARQARFLEAVDHLEQAMVVYDEQSRHNEVIACLDELGQANFAAGCYRESRDNYTRALAVCSTEHLWTEHSPHMGLARALAALDNLEQAEVHLVEAMGHYSTRNEPVQRAHVQYHLGDLYLAMGRPGIAEEHYHHVFELSQNVGHRHLAFDALVRQAYALFDQGLHDRVFELLSRAVSFAAEADDVERQTVARAHIIYLQVLLHDFRITGEAFSTLFSATDERSVQPSHVLCDLFRADLAVARGAYQEASSLLAKTRMNAASLGEYGLFIPVARREYLIGQKLQRMPDPHSGAGYALGTLMAPESGMRRFTAARFP